MNHQDLSVYLVSNSNKDRISSNRLASFTNLFPLDLTTRSTSYYLHVQELMLDHYFTSPFLPKSELLAPIIITSKCMTPFGDCLTDSQYGSIPNHHKIFLPQRTYQDWAHLTDAILRGQLSTFYSWGEKNGEIAPRIIQSRDNVMDDDNPDIVFGLFEQTTKSWRTWSKDNDTYTLFMYAPLANALAKSVEGAHKIKIKDEDYLAFNVDEYKVFFHGKKKVYLGSNFDPLVFLEISEIEPRRINDDFKPYALSFCLDVDKNEVNDGTAQYQNFFYSVKTPQYFKIASDQVRSINVRFCNRYGDTLPLAKGQPSIVSLKLTDSIPKAMEDSFMLTCTSAPQEFFQNNSTHTFSNHFTQPIQFPLNSQYECALVSISVPSRFKLDFEPFERYIMMIFYKENGEVEATKDIYFPETLHSVSEVIAIFTSHVDTKYLEVALINSTGCIVLKPMYKMQMTIRGRFFQFLGGHHMEEKVPNIIDIIRYPLGNYTFARPPQFQYYIPSALWLYCSIVKPSLLSGQMLQVLRIIKSQSSDMGLTGRNVAPVIHYNFENLQWHPVSKNMIHNIDFFMRDQSGAAISFAEHRMSITSVDLMFRRKR